MASNNIGNSTAKRRACDECRNRKLACSKQDGSTQCARCMREKLRCHYSEQKPMGRPRKRQYNGNFNDSGTGLPEVALDVASRSSLDDIMAVEPYPGANTLPFLTYTTGNPHIYKSKATEGGCYAIEGDGLAACTFGQQLSDAPPIDFSADEQGLTIDPSLASITIHEHFQNADFMDLGSMEGRDLLVNADSQFRGSGPPCTCLATMYLALSSLQALPNDVGMALHVVRAASNTAQTSIRCDRCGNSNPTVPRPSIEEFQNVMLLGTILPTIVDGYKRLLKSIDEEANEAQALGIKKIFSIQDYGGCFENPDCPGILAAYENVEMDPSQWRSHIRALLRFDVYGKDGITDGLTGVIAEMDHRQRSRHKRLDQMREAGLSICEEHAYVGNSAKDAFCLQILDKAKHAVESLVIA